MKFIRFRKEEKKKRGKKKRRVSTVLYNTRLCIVAKQCALGGGFLFESTTHLFDQGLGMLPFSAFSQRMRALACRRFSVTRCACALGEARNTHIYTNNTHHHEAKQCDDPICARYSCLGRRSGGSSARACVPFTYNRGCSPTPTFSCKAGNGDQIHKSC